MEVGSSSEPDKNWVYRLSNTKAENLRTTHSVLTKGDHYRFGLVFIKKSNQTGFLKKRTRTDSNRQVSVWFGSVFFRFGYVFSQFSLIVFHFFGLGSIRFFFFCFRLLKPKPNWTGWFFQNSNRFNWFFSRFGFFSYFFSIFSVFFAHP
jgi:hypothetical protein